MNHTPVILFIDTSAVDTARVSLTVDGGTFEKKKESRMLKSQTLLPLIGELLHEHSRALSDITDISVFLGPGSFTGLRVGCTVANALGMLLDIPVNGKRDLATPIYS